VGVIRVEPEPPVKQSACACGGTSRLLHGYVYDDEHPHGVYFVEWCEGPHPRRSAFMALGLGTFGEGTTSTDRMSFGLEWTTDGTRLTDSPVRDRPEVLGRFTPREEALRLPEVAHLWHVVDHVALDDPRLSAVRAWLDGA
jgi:hypothetical protein